MNNKEIVKYFYEVIVSENFSSYIAPDCVFKVGSEKIPLGLNGMREHLVDVKKTYPDYTMKIIVYRCGY